MYNEFLISRSFPGLFYKYNDISKYISTWNNKKKKKTTENEFNGEASMQVERPSGKFRARWAQSSLLPWRLAESKNAFSSSDLLLSSSHCPVLPLPTR